MLENLIVTGRIVDIMIAFVVVEVVVLLLVHRYTGKGIAPLPLLLNIGAGGSLMLALRAVFAGAAWWLVAACLVASLVFHVADLAQRWRGAPAA